MPASELICQFSKLSTTISIPPARHSIEHPPANLANEQPRIWTPNMRGKPTEAVPSPGVIIMLIDVFCISILLSKPFTFIVGPHKKQYIIHEAAASRLSKTLDSLLNGGMRESDERCVFWEDTDEKAFIRFGEWAYTGDYKPEEPEILLDSSQIASPDDDLPKLIVRPEQTAKSLALFTNESGDNGNQGPCAGRQNANHKYGVVTKPLCGRCHVRYSTDRCTSCVSVRYSTCQSCRNIPKQEKRLAMIEKFNNNSAYESLTTPFTPRKNTESCENYSGVFLSHAQLYVLADNTISKSSVICLLISCGLP